MASERIQRQIEGLLDDAEEAVARRDWRAVLDTAQHVLTIDPASADAQAFVTIAERGLKTAPALAARGPSGATPSPTVEQPTSFANGRYQVKEFLGEGGRKRVYRAHDSVLDRDVALAVIKVEGLDPTSRVRITREAQAMGRLGDHPHVLSIHDLGDEGGQPYMVLPLMPGGDVGTLLEKAEDHKLPLERAIDLAAQICRGLEFAHSKGIVHRDLKPGNIWLTSDGTAKIGDFGLAVAIDRSRLTQEGMMVGTVSYMPPEQAMGSEVTAKADLYSLGAMLYEMVCGRTPFLGDDSVAIIGQHINTPPVAPTWHNSECPGALEALIMRLLAKDPSERPDSAADVLTALEGIDLADVGADGRPPDEAHALDSLAGGVFVGRQREMGELKAALEDALSGRGRLVTLVGEPGIGKTRTAQELATYAGLRGCQVLWGRCHENRGAPPYWPWVQVIRSYVRERDPERLRSEMGTGAADIAEIVSDVRERIPDLKPAPAVDDPEQARFRLFDSITAFLKSASRSQPLAIILDNLHWADKPSLLLLEFLAQEFSDSRLLVIGTYRDVDLARQHPLAETLGELTRERLFQRVLLRGLSQDDVGRFIEITSGIEPPRGLVSAVHTQTEGNPLFVTEVVRLLVQEGELAPERVRERDSWEVRIPEGVREVIGRRLNRLSARCNETLTIASVVGREFELRQLVRLVEGMSEDRLLEVLEEALSARVIEELPQAVDRFQFTHALIQQTLYDEPTTTRRVRLHARILEVLEELYGPDVDAHAVELTHHAAEAEAVMGSEKVVQYSKLAGERALAAYAYEEAFGHFQRALAAKEGKKIDAETAEILSSLGSAQAALGQPEAALASLACAFDYYADTGDDSSAVGVAQTPILHLPGQVKDLTKLIGNALSLVSPDSAEAGQLLPLYGTALGVDEGDYEGAQEAFARALTIARRDKNDALEMEALVRACSVDGYHLRFHEGLQKSPRIIELTRHVDDPGCEATYRYFTALALWSTGDLELADLHADAYLAVAERLRHRFFLGSALWAKEILCRLRGDFTAARGFNDRGLAFLPRDPRLLGTRALMEFEIGEADQGRVYLQRLLDAEGAAAGGAGFEQAFAASIIPSIARISGLNEWLDVAERAGETVLSFPSVTPLVAIRAKTGMAWLAVVRRDPVVAEKRYGALEPYRGTLTPSGMWSVDHILGLLAHTMGSLEVAAGHFEAALTLCRNSGCRPEFAAAACDYADVLTERDGPGDGPKAMQLLDESLAISSELGMRPLVERVLSRKMSLQGIDVSSPETSIDAVVSAVEVERPNLQPHAAPDGTVTVMFTDIENFTPMNERLGDKLAQEVVRAHNAIIREQVAAHQGFEVKSQGDGFMVAFSSARRALECAIAIQQAFGVPKEAHQGEPIRVRIGLHTGEAIKEGEDFFGKTVILAARIASQAVGGEILVSSLLEALVESSGEFEFSAPHEVELKGLAGSHLVYQVVWHGGDSAS